MVTAFVSLLLLAQPGILSRTAATGDLNAIRTVLDSGMDPNARDDSGTTLLHYAVLHNRSDLMKLLLEHNADVNAAVTAPGVETGATPLIYAVVEDNVPLVKLLISRGAHADVSYRSGTTALHVAASGGMTEVVRLLLQNGAVPVGRDKDGLTALDISVRNGAQDVVALLLEAGSDVNAVYPKTGVTPLNEAAIAGRAAIVELLLAHKADPSMKDHAGFTPIENSVRLDHAEVVRTFLNLEKDGQLHERFPYLLEEAVAKGHVKMVEMLLDAGAGANSRFRSGATALDATALMGRVDIAELLITKGADVNSLNKFGATPLHGAALGGHLAVVNLLIVKGADINAQEGQSGATPLYMAASFGHEDVVAALLGKGADPNICTKEGMSPLHTAITNGNTAIADQIRMRGGHDSSKPR